MLAVGWGWRRLPAPRHRLLLDADTRRIKNSSGTDLVVHNDAFVVGEGAKLQAGSIPAQ